MTYLVRRIPDELWVLVKRRALHEGHTLRFILLKLLEAYARQGLPHEPETVDRGTQHQSLQAGQGIVCHTAP